MSRLAAFVFAFLLVAGAAAAENLSPRAFTDAFAASVRATIPGAKVTVTGDLQTETRDGSGKGGEPRLVFRFVHDLLEVSVALLLSGELVALFLEPS